MHFRIKEHIEMSSCSYVRYIANYISTNSWKCEVKVTHKILNELRLDGFFRFATYRIISFGLFLLMLCLMNVNYILKIIL